MSKKGAHLTENRESLEAFAKRLSSCLPERGDIKRLSDKTGCSVQAMRRWANAETEPSRDYLVAMARELDVRVSWLAAGIGPKASNASDGEQVQATVAFDAFEGILEWLVGEGVQLPVDVRIIRQFAEALSEKISENQGVSDPELTSSEVDKYASFMKAAILK